ncbi:MAG: TrkH family potassium uptake protein [Kiritimatiellales bacterium]
MNKRAVSHITAVVTLVIGLAMGVCGGLSLYWNDPANIPAGFFISAGITVCIALLLSFLTRGDFNLTRRDGFGIVTFGWIFAALFGALPYIVSGIIPEINEAVFETMSGFTTTGASVLPSAAPGYDTLESLPRGILFWRSLTQWFGGMGVLVLCVAILPFLGVGGMQIYRAEMPGPAKDRLTPRITTTAKLLWGVYFFITVMQALLLHFIAGLTWFDAVCHSFTTIATGGFSTRTDSIGAYASPSVDWIVTAFTFIAGINFALHYRALSGRPLSYFRDPECRFYFVFLFISGIFFAFNTLPLYAGNFAESLRAGFFQGTTIITTTGYSTANYDLWPSSSRMLLGIMMFTGACAGSTSGGVKLVRVFVILKKMLKEIRQFMRPQAVLQIKLGGRPVGDEVEANIAAFFGIYIGIFIVTSFLMTFFLPDLSSAITAVLTTLSNVGPGFGAVGPVHDYAGISLFGQIILTGCMLLGRLELYTVLVLFLPGFWKK